MMERKRGRHNYAPHRPIEKVHPFDSYNMYSKLLVGAMFCIVLATISIFTNVGVLWGEIAYEEEKHVQEQWKETNNGETSTSSSSQRNIAWLMSFPNSGTSYTSSLVESMSKTKVASNYGHETIGHPNNTHSLTRQPVFEDQPSGPFWLPRTNYSLPDQYVLTKTHCGIHCFQCPPNKYVETTFSFRDHCLSGSKTADDGNISQKNKYPPTRVAKAIHLMRDPFDNVVARFHLHRNSHNQTAIKFPATKDGFREFCQQLDRDFVSEERNSVVFKNHFFDILKDVPCRADFVRYVEWHNMAWITTRDLNLDILPLHYDWYTNRFNETAAEILDFLRLKANAAQPMKAFVPGKVYRDYFTPDERLAVKKAVRIMASKEIWKRMSYYFAD